MPEPQDVSDKMIEPVRRRVSVEELQQAIIDLDEWARKRLEAIDRAERLTAEDYATYIGPTFYNPRT